MDARVEEKSIKMSQDVERIKVIHAALEERNGEVVLRGVIAPESLCLLKVDDYQREVLRPVASSRKPSKIKQAVIANKPLPDVELGMRGQQFSSRGSTFYLENDVYIIDGLQRISTVRDWNDLNPDAPTETQIGAKIHFGTDKAWEKEQFEILNTARTAMSPNVLLRNLREDYNSILTIYGLCFNEADFALYGRVSWKQYMNRGDLVSALIVARTAASLYQNMEKQDAPKGSVKTAGTSGSSAKSLASSLEQTSKALGLKPFREGIKTFFGVIDQCFGLRVVEYRELSVATKGNFLVTLASVMADHKDFWRGNNLHVDNDMKKRLRTFAVHDPKVEQLSGAGNSATPLLYRLMVDHLNKRRQKKLQERK